MKLHFAKPENHALTLIEMLVIIGLLAVLAVLFWPPEVGCKKRAQKISCVNNLKQIGLAIKIWAGDNGDRYPMQVPATNGGAMGLTETFDGLKVFQVTSNELSTPKVLYCPQDTLRHGAAANFTDDLTNKISYFIGIDATDANPQLLLSGDDNFLLNRSPAKPGMVSVASPARLAWDGDRHGSLKQGWFIKPKKIGTGNILLTDGSVQETVNSSLTNFLSQTGLATNRFFIP